MALAGISTLGITTGYAISTDGSKPTTGYKALTRIKSVGGVDVTPEKLDASTLEDLESKFIAGRSSVSDTLDVVFNVTDDTLAEWEPLLGKQIVLENIVPSLSKGLFVLITVPSQFPKPALDDSSVLTATMSCTVNDYSKANGYGFAEKVDFQ